MIILEILSVLVVGQPQSKQRIKIEKVFKVCDDFEILLFFSEPWGRGYWLILIYNPNTWASDIAFLLALDYEVVTGQTMKFEVLRAD